MARLIYSAIASLDGYELESAASARTRIEPSFDAAAIRRLKSTAEHDMAADVYRDLELLDTRRFSGGVIYLRYGIGALPSEP
jgi:hypothetical protein